MPASPPGKPHCLLNPKWPPGAPKKTDVVQRSNPRLLRLVFRQKNTKGLVLQGVWSYGIETSQILLQYVKDIKIICKKTRLISIESQPKKIVVEVVVVIGVGVVVHVVAVVIPVVDTRNIHNKVWLKPGY